MLQNFRFLERKFVYNPSRDSKSKGLLQKDQVANLTSKVQMLSDCHMHPLVYENGKEQSDTHALRTKVSLGIGIKNRNQIPSESITVKTFFWRQKEVLFLFPLQMCTLQSNQQSLNVFKCSILYPQPSFALPLQASMLSVFFNALLQACLFALFFPSISFLIPTVRATKNCEVCFLTNVPFSQAVELNCSLCSIQTCQ